MVGKAALEANPLDMVSEFSDCPEKDTYSASFSDRCHERLTEAKEPTDNVLTMYQLEQPLYGHHIELCEGYRSFHLDELITHRNKEQISPELLRSSSRKAVKAKDSAQQKPNADEKPSVGKYILES
ncbi:hypothetical protein STEG23_010079 [Scotinomys teguina]